MTTSLPKLLITGANGQLGHALSAHPGAQAFQLIALSRQALNVDDEASVIQAIQQHQPDAIIHTAAYTAVDKAESEQTACEQTNHHAAACIAKQCAKHHIPLIHLSTDYVFDGQASSPYLENHPTAPLNYYGASKLRGEEAVRAHCPQHVILRVSGIFSRHGHNFMNTMLRLANERDTLRIVADQTTCPTAAHDIAGALYQIATRLSHWGTYHYCSTPATSWHAFATEIIHAARKQGDLKVKTIDAITTNQYPTPAKRPAYSVLDCAKLKRDYGIDQPDWRIAVNTLVKGTA